MESIVGTMHRTCWWNRNPPKYNHFGINRTDLVCSSDQIRESLTGLSLWLPIVSLTNNMNLPCIIQINTCEKSQRNNHQFQKASGILHPIPVSPKIWCRAGMDLIGPMPETPRGNKYVVLITDQGQVCKFTLNTALFNYPHRALNY